jgi:hypothetical protein
VRPLLQCLVLEMVESSSFYAVKDWVFGSCSTLLVIAERNQLR